MFPITASARNRLGNCQRPSLSVLLRNETTPEDARDSGTSSSPCSLA